jgi:DNA polymerase
MSDIIPKTEKLLRQIEQREGNRLYINKSIMAEEEKQQSDETTGQSLFGYPESPENTQSWQNARTLDQLYDMIHSCNKCPLGETRNKFVFGEGNPDSAIMVIGEGPGADEDAQGRPFVGRAGQLLTKILNAIGFDRKDVFIGNIVKCRPPNNRRPESSEVEHCEPYLHKQIELINPRFIVALGLTAVDTLLKKKHRMADIRGSFMDYRGREMLVTYHPAALLRNPNLKKAVWEDVKELRRKYDEYIESK